MGAFLDLVLPFSSTYPKLKSHRSSATEKGSSLIFDSRSTTKYTDRSIALQALILEALILEECRLSHFSKITEFTANRTLK